MCMHMYERLNEFLCAILWGKFQIVLGVRPSNHFFITRFSHSLMEN